MIDAGNTAWLITATALVLFMTLPGLALFYGGLVRAENLLSVLMHSFIIACLASVLWLAGAYSLAFHETGLLHRYRQTSVQPRTPYLSSSPSRVE